MRLTVHALNRLIGTGLVLSLLTYAPAALASDGQRGDVAGDRPDVTLHTEEFTGWDVATTGKVFIDGRLAHTIDRVDFGSKIKVDAMSSARAEIKGVGRVSIAPRSELTLDMIDDTVVANLAQGSMRVEIGAKYGSYVETPDTKIVSYPGSFASFRVRAVPGGETTLEKGLGDVAILASDNDAAAGLSVDTVGDDDDYHVSARGKHTLRVRVQNNGSSVPNQSVTFAITTALGGASGQFTDGVQRITTSTDGDGVASVEFESGASSGTVYVEAFIPGTEAHETVAVFVNAKEKTFWNTTTVSIYTALAVGAIVGTTLAIQNRGRDDNTPVITPAPPVVNP
jgi:hypothetical protein